MSRIVIIGGCGSSGTTLLTHILSRHSAIRSGPELNIFNQQFIYDYHALKKWARGERMWAPSFVGYFYADRFATNLDALGLSEQKFKNLALKSKSVPEFLSSLGDMLCANKSQIFLEKTPSNVYHFLELHRELPQAKLIFMVRDPRDVAVSLRRRGFSLGHGVGRWLFDNSIGVRASQTINCALVRYEDLITSPEEVVTELCEFIEICPHQDLIGAHSEDDTEIYTESWRSDPQRRAWNSTPSDALNAHSIEQWKQNLSETDLQLMSDLLLTKDVCRAYGLPRYNVRELAAHLNYEDWHLSTTEPDALKQGRSDFLSAERIKRSQKLNDDGFQDSALDFFTFQMDEQ